jgi:hypothetical protein
MVESARWMRDVELNHCEYPVTPPSPSAWRAWLTAGIELLATGEASAGCCVLLDFRL